ncbi:MAG: iron-sulfur cluster insertion protein ErpA [Alphaproteobacteria bacterium]|nr:iron-sulfur cluster insertion protein ErpA [Alphaproteobacteria bacterium]
MTETTTNSGDSGTPAGVGLSESAVAKLSGLIAAEGGADQMLRITVNGGGCSGFTYAFDFDDSANDDDHTFETDGVKVVVDAASLEFIDGAVLNYVESLGGSHFTLENPNATSSCGCGSSFSVY